MTHSHYSSSGSVSCRLEWRPSRALACTLVSLSLLAAFSVLVSELARAVAWPLACWSLGYGAWRVRGYRRLPRQQFVFPGNGLPVLRDGLPLQAVAVQWRGPLAFVSWREGKGPVQRLVWWPDTLPPARRRELRLAAGMIEVTRQRPGMAP